MDKEIKKEIINHLDKDEPIPAEYEDVLFPTTKKEYELRYSGKDRKEVILNKTLSVPFQPVKQFGTVKKGEWHNMLIFGDNLQALKHLLKLKNDGKLKNSDGSDGVKLVYIDPPFATKREFRGSQEQIAYHDKIIGAKFLEFLRKRLIFLKELMAEDGCIYIHLDEKKLHYIKILMDEIFGENNYISQITWYYYNKLATGFRKFPKATDYILMYCKNSSSNYFFKVIEEKRDEPVKQLVRKYHEGKAINVKNAAGELEYRIRETRRLDNVWRIRCLQPADQTENLGFPTQKPEDLIWRVIEASSQKGNIVLDCFAGSGTTGAVAEKIKDENSKNVSRRWIMCDCSKLAIYTMTKRLLNLKEEIGNKGKPLKHKPFVLYNAGLYNDKDLINQIEGPEYKDFVLELFGCQKREHKINGLSFHGTLNNHSVMVFDKKHFLTEEFINDLHDTIGSVIKGEVYIIAPVGVVGFNEDYKPKGKVRYTILRIPNSIIEHIKEMNFTRLEQPRSIAEINQTIDSFGFDFVYPPKVKAKYYFQKPKGKLINKEYVIEIEEFEPVQPGSKIIEFKDPKKESLAMIMIDINYDGDTFNLSKYFFGDEIIKNNFKINFDNEIGENVMVIYLDILGNERKEVVKRSDFKVK